MLTLFHAPQSRSSRFIWLLEELGADYEIRYVDIPRIDGSGRPDPSNPHPDKKVPALVHDGALVTESAAICLYLTDLHPAAGIGPVVGDPKRGPYLTWLAYYAGVIEPVAVIAFAGLEGNAALARTFRGRNEMSVRRWPARWRGTLRPERSSACGPTASRATAAVPGTPIVDSDSDRTSIRGSLTVVQFSGGQEG